MSKSIEDLKAAFAGESQAGRRYTAFAQKADEEGYPQVARLFRAAAAAESVHAVNHLRAMSGVKSTSENLQEAIGGENYEWVSMYPEMIKDAQEENDKKALSSFRWAMEVEKTHEKLYRESLTDLSQKMEEYDYYVCPVCGHTEPRSAPERCPVCGAAGSRFMKIS